MHKERQIKYQKAWDAYQKQIEFHAMLEGKVKEVQDKSEKLLAELEAEGEDFDDEEDVETTETDLADKPNSKLESQPLNQHSEFFLPDEGEFNLTKA